MQGGKHAGANSVLKAEVGQYTNAADALPAGVGELVWPSARLMRVRRGQLLIGGGNMSTEVYIVLEGSVQISMFSAHGKEVILRTIRAGKIFGELAALDLQPEELLLPRHAEELPDLAVRPADRRRRHALAPIGPRRRDRAGAPRGGHRQVDPHR